MKLKIITNFPIIEKFIKDIYLLKVKRWGRGAEQNQGG